MSWSKSLLASFGAAGIAAAAAACSTAAAQVVSLQSYNVDINQTSVSGLSSGGYMAVQFDVAFSSILRGAGVVAGGPYYCAQGSLMAATSTCSCVFGCFGQSSTNVAQLITITDRNAGRGLIDGTRNLANHRIWMFSGTSDTVVPQRIMNDLFTYYRHYIDAANISYKNDIAAEHAMPTDYFGNPCMTRDDPFINNCNYDGAGQLLRWIYGNLNPKNTGQLGGAFINFNQGEFIDQPNDHGMASDGWLYVPVNCSNRQICTLHVVFHGCKQYETYRYSAGGAGLVTFGTTYVRNTGYNKWADTNNIIMLYPQATASSQNPNGCWDWWGYDDPDYAAKSGRQMAAVKRMIDRIVSGHSGLPAPADLQTTAVTDASVSLSWSPVASASGFNVYRDRNKAAGSPVTATSFTDAGLSPGNTYRYTVAAIDFAGVEGAASNPLEVTTTGTSVVLAPTDPRIDAVSDSSVALSWKAPAGVAGFDVFRGASSGGPYSKVNADLVTDPSFTDAGLTANTTYFYVVKSVDPAGGLSAPSSEVSAKTQMAPACFTATNFDHVVAGRAHDSFFVAVANGSNQIMGLDNVFIVTTLKQTGPDFYVIALCP
ncbi:MAG TPA: fibronectin type III domain-containing protein [Xanthobacteraceae bacterium]|nr:fibronectin type III domain-containing protein [Xanthobacteraceae bacterium]